MTEQLVLCEGASAKGRTARRRKGAPEPLRLSTAGQRPNLRLQVENITRAFLRDVQPRCRDLLRIAAYVYGADTSVSRGTRTDVYADRWSRAFRFVVPVLDLPFWCREDVAGKLSDTLEYLTGDSFAFEFIEASREQGQLLINSGSVWQGPCSASGSTNTSR